MKTIVTTKYGITAGAYEVDSESLVVGSAPAIGDAVLMLALDVAQPDPPPSDDPPQPPVTSDPPPSDAGSSDPLPSLPPAPGDGTHATRAISIIDGVSWVAQAKVGEDPQAAFKFVKFADAAGNVHPSLRAYFYADCCDVGAVNGRDGYDYHGSLTIQYDDETVYDAHLVDFWRGTLNQTIRYGKHQPTWQPVDKSLFPIYATPDAPLPLQTLAKYDWSYNGMGCATYAAMGTTGSRIDIAFVPGWDISAILQPSDAAYAVVRKIADQSGVWPIYFIDDDTGYPFDITQYPATTFQAYIQAKYPGNPIAQYGDTPSWSITGSPYKWDCAHETGYNFVAAAATMSARDRFHAGVWANAVLTAFNPNYRQQTGVWAHYQERGTAWSLRSLFLASYLSDRAEYFAARLEEQRVQGEAQLTHPLGFQATYVNRSFPDGSKGTAPWEENYTRAMVATIAHKLPAWSMINDRLKKWLVGILATPQWQLSTLYCLASHDANGAPLTTWDEVFRHSLAGTLDGSTPKDPPNPIWADADIDALLQPNVTVAQVSALIRKSKPGWPGKDGDWCANYPTSCQDYGAIQTAAIAEMCGDGLEWKLCQSVPTKPNWAQGWQWNIVPVAA